MNEIEAISVLEIRIKYPNSDTYAGMCEAEYLQEAVVAAIEALREKAERVLCAKCKHYNKTGCSEGFGWCESMDRGVSDDFYCANGAKMDGGTDNG